MDSATAPIAVTMPSPKLTPALVQGSAAPCTLRILGRWAGHATVKLNEAQCVTCIIYYYYLLMYHYYILLLDLLLLIIAICYYTDIT